MEKIELMHAIYGTKPHCKCGHYCHFFHWKIEGKGENRHQAYRWCEIYGLNKKDVTETDWDWEYPACGYFNVCADPPKRNLYKMVKNGKEIIDQLSLF